MRIIIHIIVIIFLTITTQIGGLIYIISILLINKKTKKRRIKRIGIFSVLYLFVTFLIVPNIAPIFGREKVRETELIGANTFFTKLMNRNYVKPKLNQTLNRISKGLNQKHKGIKLIYLDANFPFINKFPLLPHLSHNDGKKIDLSLIYQTKEGKLTNKKPSVSGYGVYEKPKENEIKQYKICKDKGYWQYDFPKYLTFGTINKEIEFSQNATKDLILNILKQKEIGKIFIEPHLKERMKLNNNKIRFHGCRAVRHDDHIHIQLK
jgi:hypothetical protein